MYPSSWSQYHLYLLCMQPYLGLALPRPVSGPQTSLVWTVRALGSCLATLLTGAVFRWGIETPGTTTAGPQVPGARPAHQDGLPLRLGAAGGALHGAAPLGALLHTAAPW